jgi:hypothetical protein
MMLEEKYKDKYSHSKINCLHCLEILKNQNFLVYNNLIEKN